MHNIISSAPFRLARESATRSTFIFGKPRCRGGFSETYPQLLWIDRHKSAKNRLQVADSKLIHQNAQKMSSLLHIKLTISVFGSVLAILIIPSYKDITDLIKLIVAARAQRRTPWF
jgi:hypothetical protein